MHLALHEQGLALETTSALGDETVGGALATATHNTGRGQGVMASYATAITLMAADGSLHKLKPASEEKSIGAFEYALCGLGTLGVIVEASFATVPAFRLHKTVRDLPLAELLGPEMQPVLESASSRVLFFVDPFARSVRLFQREVTEEPVTGAWDEQGTDSSKFEGPWGAYR